MIDYSAIRALQAYCFQNAVDKGFHADRPYTDKELVPYQGNKMMLMVGELSEAHEELRKGHPVTETYYPTAAGQTRYYNDGKLFKPEGVPSELADTVIRILDFCGAEGIDLASMIEEKLAYNASREYLHGKKF